MTQFKPHHFTLALLVSLLTLPPHTFAANGNAWLGLTVEALSFEALQEHDLEHGLSISKVSSNSPAAQAGLQVGDLLLEFDTKSLFSVARLQWFLRNHRPDDKIDLTYLRDKSKQRAQIVLGSWQAQARHHDDNYGYQGTIGNSHLGVSLQSLSDDLRQHFGAPTDRGMLVAKVDNNSPAADAGLKVGDIIIRLDRRSVRHMGDIYRVLNFFEAGEEIEIELIRDKTPIRLQLKLGQGYQQRHPMAPPMFGPPPFNNHPHFPPALPMPAIPGPYGIPGRT